MGQRTVIQLLLIFVALTSVNSKQFHAKTFLKEVFISQPFESARYVITRQSRLLNLETARETCSELGGSLTSLERGTEEFDYVKASIVQSEVQGPLFFINRANPNIRQWIPDSVNDKPRCTAIMKMNGPVSEAFYLINFISCDRTGHVVCEVDFSASGPKEYGPKQVLMEYYVSPPHKGRVYLINYAFREWFYPETSNEVCKKYGGYLWEFEDSDEFDFVQRYVRSLRMQNNYIYTGGNCRATKGRFVCINSGKLVSMTDGTKFPWGDIDPKWFSCIILFGNALTTASCNPFKSSQFMCEVPI